MPSATAATSCHHGPGRRYRANSAPPLGLDVCGQPIPKGWPSPLPRCYLDVLGQSRGIERLSSAMRPSSEAAKERFIDHDLIDVYGPSCLKRAAMMDDLQKTVFAVPPFARHPDLTPNRAANAALIRHLEAGG